MKIKNIKYRFDIKIFDFFLMIVVKKMFDCFTISLFIRVCACGRMVKFL